MPFAFILVSEPVLLIFSTRNTHAMATLVRTPLRPLPPIQHALIFNLQNLHLDRPTSALHIASLPRLTLIRLPPPPSAQIAPRTRTQRTQQILLRKESNTTFLRRRTGLHKVPSLRVQPRDLKHIQHIVHIKLRQSMRQHRPHKIRVAVEIIIRAGDDRRDIRIAPRPEQIVTPAPPLGHPAARIPSLLAPAARPAARPLSEQTPVTHDAGQGPHEGEIRPQPVALDHVAAL